MKRLCPNEMARTKLQNRARLAWLVAALLVVLERRQCAAGFDHASQLKDCFNAAYKAASSWDDYMNVRVGSMWLHDVLWSSKDSRLPLTIFTITTTDRLESVEKQCMHYPGPQVTAAFVPLIVHGGEAAAGAALARGSKQQGRGAPQQQGAAAGPSQPPSLTKSQQARLKHVVKRLKDMFNRLEQQPEACAMRVLVFYELVTAPALAFLIPVNALRNAALLAASTPLVAMVDADLTIVDTLAQLLRDKRRLEKLSAGCQARTAYVMPAFDTLQSASWEERLNVSEWAMSIPASQKAKLQTSKIRIFNWPFEFGHGPTNYTAWFKSKTDYVVSYHLEYEPWVIMSRTQMPPYDARYRGYFYNKAAHIHHVAALGFTFRVLPDVWLMHWPHRPQAAWAAHPYTKYHGISKHNIERDAREAMLEVHEHGGRNKTTSVLHHDMMMSLMQQQVYQLAKYGSNGEHAFAPVVGEQAEWCLKVLPWWGQEQGQGEVR